MSDYPLAGGRQSEMCNLGICELDRQSGKGTIWESIENLKSIGNLKSRKFADSR